MHPDDVKSFVDSVERSGLTLLGDRGFEDVGIVDQREGPTASCAWLRSGRSPRRGSSIPSSSRHRPRRDVWLCRQGGRRTTACTAMTSSGTSNGFWRRIANSGLTCLSGSKGVMWGSTPPLRRRHARAVEVRRPGAGFVLGRSDGGGSVCPMQLALVNVDSLRRLQGGSDGTYGDRRKRCRCA